jgi:peptidoglycan/xylan/chitin deacetylase (PgdA/CDA1 family)
MISMPYGIMFHHFYEEGVATGQGAITADELQRILNHVGRENIISAQEWMHLSIEGNLETHHVCLTFDDALRCQYNIALPVLEANGLTAFWFVYSSVFQGCAERLEVYRHFRVTQFSEIDDFYHQFEQHVKNSPHSHKLKLALEDFSVQNYLTHCPFYSDGDRRFRFIRNEVLGEANYNVIMDQMLDDRGVEKEQLLDTLWMNDEHLKELNRNDHVVGLHSYTHPIRLANLSLPEQNKEYNLNAQHLTKVLGTQPISMSHPTNSYGPETLELLRSMGICVGFRADMTQPNGSALEQCRKDHSTIMMELSTR